MNDGAATAPLALDASRSTLRVRLSIRGPWGAREASPEG